eukprot:GHVT01039029.1.p1 GENE.GHVT01039029.1~~GHVT01039029.1.p1  ORF type:complete len:821 (+),score=269.49 GHVT01039029.1:137-2599(+)
MTPEMEPDVAAIAAALVEVAGEKLDSHLAEYLAGMLEAEGGASLSASEASELVGPFLMDCGCVASLEEAEVLCAKLRAALGARGPEGENPQGAAADSDDEPNEEAEEEDDDEHAEDDDETTPTGKPADVQVKLDRPILLGDLMDQSGGFVDPFLGLSRVSANYNSMKGDPGRPSSSASPASSGSSAAASSAMAPTSTTRSQQREREKALRMMQLWTAKTPLPPPRRLHGDADVAKPTDISIDCFSVSVGGRVLLKDGALKLSLGRKYGLIGRNGIGKSTFLKALARKEIPGLPADVSFGAVEQELEWTDTSVLNAVLAVDADREELLEEVKQLEAEETHSVESGRRLVWVYDRLNLIGAADAVSEASTILAGLGFSEAMMQSSVLSLSGGWRMRVALARMLFAASDVMLLDEPTNHLDLHAVQWLADFLATSPGTAVIVSHARHFLNDVCTDVIHFVDQKLDYYRGNFDTFESSRADRLLQQKRQVEANAATRKHMQQFIDKFRYNAKRASLVQSRLKALAKLPMLEAVANDPALCFDFPEPEALPSPLVRFDDVSFRYAGRGASAVSPVAAAAPAADADKRESEPDGGQDRADKEAQGEAQTPPTPAPEAQAAGKMILRNVDLSIDMESRLAICGVNGSGKSTLLKILVGLEEPTDGFLKRHGRLRIGYFTQHHVDQMDLTLTAVQQLQTQFPEMDLKDEEARNFLGRFGISGLLALEPLYILSGGQKSRVAIALIAFRKPHLLVLDEPTNHLDLDAVQALIVALSSFKGGVVIVSHDAHLLSCVVDEVWHVEPTDQKCTKFHGDFENYRKQILKQAKK